MTAKEMQIAFGIELNQFDDRLQLDSDDIFHWLNAAQEHYVRARFVAFETDQHITDDIRVLLKTNEEQLAVWDSVTNKPFFQFEADKADFPEDYLFYISSRSNIQYIRGGLGDCCLEDPDENGTRVLDEFCKPYKDIVVENRTSQQDDIYRLLSDPFNTTKYNSPLAVQTDEGVRIYTDDTFIVKKVFFDYLRVPLKITIKGDGQDSELPVFTHREIVELGVTLFLNNTRNLKERFQRETPLPDSRESQRQRVN